MDLVSWSWIFLIAYIGGFIAALAGPLVLGSIWKGVTSRGALIGFWTGVVVFVLIHAQMISRFWPVPIAPGSIGDWFAFHARSPYSAATMAAICGVVITVVVSTTGRQRNAN